MSSTTESLKKSASEVAAEEPSAKKAKIAENEHVLDDKSVDNNNKPTANKQADNNETDITDGDSKAPVASSGSSVDKAKIPTKSANGNDNSVKGPQSDNQDDIDEENEIDEDDDDEDGSGVFDPMTTHQLGAVEGIQLEISKLNELAGDEILVVEQKYNKLRRPFFEKRSTLLKSIPNFWVTTLANHPSIAPMINTPEDEDCLHYMVSLDVEEFEDIKSGYTLKFHFVENPYITNDVVQREVRLIDREEVLTAASALEYQDTPKAKSLKAIVERSISQRPRNGQFQSFFGWLTHSINEPGPDEVAEIIKDHIWPAPLEYFFAAAGSYEDAGSDDSDDEEDYDEEADVDHGEIEEYLDEELDNDDDLDDEDDGEIGGDDDEDDDDEEEDEDDEE